MKDLAVPSDYRMILWMMDFHGPEHTERYISRFPDQKLMQCLAEMEELGLVEHLSQGCDAILDEKDQVPEQDSDVVAVANSELPLITEALTKHGGYVAEDRLRERRPLAKPRQELRVLIVEDDPDQLALADLRVAMAGYTVQTANSQAAMLQSLADKIPDLLLLDVMLTDGHGFQILKSLRRLRSFKALPIVLLTARTNPADIIEGLRLGADGYITKPYSKNILANVIDRVLGAST